LRGISERGARPRKGRRRADSLRLDGGDEDRTVGFDEAEEALVGGFELGLGVGEGDRQFGVGAVVTQPERAAHPAGVGALVGEIAAGGEFDLGQQGLGTNRCCCVSSKSGEASIMYGLAATASCSRIL
jgi:hypothetical protein